MDGGFVVEARSGPGEQYTTVFTVHEGLTAELKETASDWQRIVLGNGLEGWIPRTAGERI